MQTQDLNKEERSALRDALRSSHTRRIYVSVTNLDGDVLSNVSARILDGQVVVDMDADITRTATLTLLDPHHSLNFDSDSPDDGALYADRMLKIFYSVLVESLGRHVSIVVFHGPITHLERKGDTVDLEAHGKEALASGAIWRPLTLKKGALVTDAIQTLLKDRAGETRFSFPRLSDRLKKARSLDRYSSPWKVARSLASGLDRQLFYDGRGVATLRDVPETPLWTFRTGTGGDVLSDLTVAYTTEDVKNTIVVVGGKPKGAKERVRATAIAEPSHPLSPQRLGRNGVPRHLVETITDDSIGSQKAAEAKARRILNDRLRAVVDVTFDALPIPHLDPGDLVAVETDEVRVEFRLRKFSIPLGLDGDPVMPVGYHRKTTVNRKRIRR